MGHGSAAGNDAAGVDMGKPSELRDGGIKPVLADFGEGDGGIAGIEHAGESGGIVENAAETLSALAIESQDLVKTYGSEDRYLHGAAV